MSCDSKFETEMDHRIRALSAVKRVLVWSVVVKKLNWCVKLALHLVSCLLCLLKSEVQTQRDTYLYCSTKSDHGHTFVFDLLDWI